MSRITMINSFLALLVTTQVWSQQQSQSAQTEQRINSNGESYVLESSDAKASNLPSGIEQFAILETGSKGEAKADLNKVVLERSFDTADRVRVKLKTPLFKYKPIISGTSYYVETTKEVVDPKTGLTVRVKDIAKKRLVWCGLEPCLLSSQFLLQACVRDQKTCSSAYDTIIIDFKRAKKLELGETEEFFVSAYQRKIPGKAIDFFVYPIPGRIKAPRYIIEHKTKLFGPDVYVVRLPTQKELDVENKLVNAKDVLDLEAATELNSNTRYTTLPTNIGIPGQAANPNSNGNVLGQGEVVEELCIDPIDNKIASRKTVLEGGSSSTVRTYGTTTVLESSSDVTRIEKSADAKACVSRKQTLVLGLSLAGQKNAINRNEYLKKTEVKKIVEESSEEQD